MLNSGSRLSGLFSARLYRLSQKHWVLYMWKWKAELDGSFIWLVVPCFYWYILASCFSVDKAIVLDYILAPLPSLPWPMHTFPCSPTASPSIPHHWTSYLKFLWLVVQQLLIDYRFPHPYPKYLRTSGYRISYYNMVNGSIPFLGFKNFILSQFT